MDFINFHIAYLLTNHECVIIPDFGAFVVSKKITEKSNKRGFISPPASYSLTFNPEIIQDDGLLVHSIAKGKGIDYPEALRLIYDYVDSLVNTLREGQAVQFPWIGKIHLSDDRKIVFTPAKNLSCNASNCGLVNLNFPYLTEEAAKEEFAEKPKKIYKRPVFYVILTAIVLLLFALFIFLFPDSLNKTPFSLPNMPTISNFLKIDSVKPITDTIPLINKDSVKPFIADSAKSVSSEFYIIIFSTMRENDANTMMNYFLAKGYNKAKILNADGKYRISIESFKHKEDAVTFTDTLKKNGSNPLFKDAWIFEASH